MDLGRWVHLGHRLGECWHDDTRDISYIHIPKNASSFIKACLIGAGGYWRHSETLVNSKENLIILRDPIDRWCTGIAQYLYNSNQPNMLEELIFDTITFDDHTDLQTYFLQGVNLDAGTFILLDCNLKSTFTNWIKEHGYCTDISIVNNYNSSRDDAREQIKLKYVKLLAETPSLMLKLKKHFEKDYELINRVKFYGN